MGGEETRNTPAVEVRKIDARGESQRCTRRETVIRLRNWPIANVVDDMHPPKTAFITIRNGAVRMTERGELEILRRGRVVKWNPTEGVLRYRLRATGGISVTNF